MLLYVSSYLAQLPCQLRHHSGSSHLQKASREQRLWQMHRVLQEAELEDLKAGEPERI